MSTLHTTRRPSFLDIVDDEEEGADPKLLVPCQRYVRQEAWTRQPRPPNATGPNCVFALADRPLARRQAG